MFTMDQGTAGKFIQEKENISAIPQNIIVQSLYHHKPFTINNMPDMERR